MELDWGGIVSNNLVVSHETKWTPEQTQLLKDTVCKGATDDEFKIFCYAVQRTGLDPFMRQIHSVKRWNAKANREDMSIQVGIDGYRLIADRTGLYAGNEEAVFDNEKAPNKATVVVYKMVQGQRCPFSATARWAEYYPGDKQGFMWKKMPCVMLGKVAEALALRKAFPAELSGVYTNEEMEQASREPKEIQNEPSTPVIVQKLAPANPGGNGPAVIPPVDAVALETRKITQLKTELGISTEELKFEVHQLFGTSDSRALNLDQLKQVTELLENEKKARAAPSSVVIQPKEPGSDDDEQAPWLQESMGPAPSGRAQGS